MFLIIIPKVEAKELYFCTVKYVDHDDYFEYIKPKQEEKVVVEQMVIIILLKSLLVWLKKM